MLLQTKEFQDTLSSISVALSADKNVTHIELKASQGTLFINATNNEFFVSVRYPLTVDEDFYAVINATSFISLVSSLKSETIELSINDNSIQVKTGKSKYSFAISTTKLNKISLSNREVECQVSNEILENILKVNGVEVKKAISDEMEAIHQQYFFTNEACFTFTTGACLNLFNLGSNFKILLNNRIVKLFKLFNEPATMFYGVDRINDLNQAKIVLFTDTVFVIAIVTNDDSLKSSLENKFEAAKRLANDPYKTRFTIDSDELLSTVKRFTTFTKNTTKLEIPSFIPARITFKDNTISIVDSSGNTDTLVPSEIISAEESSVVVNLCDILDRTTSYKSGTIEVGFGDNRSILLKKDSLINLICKLPNDYV